jgi:signal transduction histidine kinase
VRHTSHGEIRVAAEVHGAHLTVTVDDTGPRNAQFDLQRDARASRESAGLGCGIALVRRTAALLGHEISVETPSTGGTSVRVRLPLAEPGL